MECREVRELADSFLSEQLLVETTHQILAHLATCPSCRAEIESRRRLRTALRGAFERSADLQASPEFLASLGDRVRRQAAPAQSWRAWRPFLALAAGLVLAVGVALGGRAWLGASLIRAAVGDHQNCAVRYALKERPISLELAAERFDPAYRSLIPLTPSPARLAAGELTVLERHSCVYDGRRFAHIVLRYHGALVSVLVTPDRLARVPRALVAAEGTHVSSFRIGRFAAFVVSSASEEDTHDVAGALAGPLNDALTGA